jgi:hypothetical protein
MNEYRIGDKLRVPDSVTGKPATGLIVALSKGRYHIRVTIDGSDVVTTLLQRTQEELNAEGFVKL